MKTSDFNFDLPQELVAQFPCGERGQSRLMVVDRKARRLEHLAVNDLPSLLPDGTLMVFNDSRVRRARLIGASEATGAEVEFLLVEKLRESGGFLWRAMVQRARRRRTGSRYIFRERGSLMDGSADSVSGGIVIGEIASEEGEFRTLKFDRPIDDAWLDANAHVPLPPYIRRDDRVEDGDRYQTVYAREHGSAAAPTAGLHFTNGLLDDLERAGIETAFITLHVGLGTFLPVRTGEIEDHKMHEEAYFISEECAAKIERARGEGRTVLAVGTTSLRTLESAWADGPGRINRGEGSTSIFIYPGYKFRIVDALFTNFHTPGSTLLMLVSAFAGREFILESYMEAIKQGYRFYSYGDACLIL